MLEAPVLDQQLPRLRSSGAEVVRVGETGMGSTARLIDNMLALCNSAAAEEALMLGERAGIGLHKLDAVIRNASGTSAGY
jgi:3-hydroxyisobutyrate dehydrogenase-like beta-hydroxyacid dehydrogenase